MQSRSTVQAGTTGHRPQVATSLLQSLQRRFIVQQTLDTPGLHASQYSQPQDEDLDGFVLHSQPAYERLPSQRLLEDENLTEDEDEAEPLTDLEHNHNYEMPGFQYGGFEGCSIAPVEEPVTYKAAEEERLDVDVDVEYASQPLPPTVQRNPSLDNLGRTPGIHSVDRVQLNGGPLFPVYRSCKGAKTIYLVRHGESEYNAYLSAAGTSWADPLMFDAALTMKGKNQVWL